MVKHNLSPGTGKHLRFRLCQSPALNRAHYCPHSCISHATPSNEQRKGFWSVKCANPFYSLQVVFLLFECSLSFYSLYQVKKLFWLRKVAVIVL